MEIKRLIVGILDTNCYLLVSGGELAVIDPGGDPDKILEETQKSPAKTKYIINTHSHPDHISGNERIKKETAAQILIHENEKDFIDFQADRFLKEGEKLKVGDTVLKVLNTPGHTGGSICLLGDNFIFTGDTLFKDGYGRTDLPGGSQGEMEDSLKRLSGIIKPGMMVYPGHGEAFKNGNLLVE